VVRRFLAMGLLAAAAALTPTLAEAATGYLSGRTKMRAGPDHGYPTVAVIRRGEGVVIHGCLADKSWCDVSFEGERGWMPTDKLMDETVKGRVPVVSPRGRQTFGTVHFNLDQYWDTYYHGRFDNRRGDWQRYWHDRDRHGRPDRDRDQDRDRDRDRRHD